MSLQERFDALPADFQSDALRTAVLEHDNALAQHVDAQSRLTAARQAVEDARAAVVLGRDDTWNALLTASQLLTACEMVAPRWPAPGVVYVPEATDVARDALQRAVGAIPAVVALDLEMEMPAYKSWPQHWHSLAASPIVMPGDTALLASAEAFRSERSDNLRAVESWNQPVILGDTLGALERAASLLVSIADVTARGAVIAEQVRASNKQRRALGLGWDSSPKSIPNSDAYTSPEMRALAKYRREREEREAVPV